MANEVADCETPKQKSTSAPSTLIEFPGAGRSAQPPWRKELSERVREIQERRSRDAEREAHERQMQLEAQALEDPGETPLGLVPRPDQPPLNPIVVKALKRIERAQQGPQRSPVRTGTRGASVAVARVPEEQFEVRREAEAQSLFLTAQDVQQDNAPVEKPAAARRPHSLSVVQPQLIVEGSTANVTLSATDETAPRVPLQSLKIETQNALVADEFYDDCAPFASRTVAGIIDLFVIVFASSPFAAIIELTNGDWTDERVIASMGIIFIIVMFLYLTASTSIGGRTWGMSLLSLRAVDVDSGLPPTTKQSITRAVVYMLSLATFCIGILYALVDAERRSVHDHLSGTTVIRE